MRLEVNMVVSDAKAAGKYYEKLLKAEILSETDYDLGMNEVMIKLGGFEVRVMDQNEKFGMFAPTKAGGGSMWLNIWVEDIEAYFEHVVNQGVNVMSPVQEFPGPAKNAVFSDKFNHVWVINQSY